MTEEELQDMIDQADRDGDGEINPDEFYRIMKKRGDNPLDDLLCLCLVPAALAHHGD